MKDIKFRAFNGDRIVKVNAVGWADGEIYWVDTSKNDDFDEGLILMQYTGLKDKKGVEIYEGDIVKSFSNINKYTDDFAENVEPTYYFSEIVYHNGCFKNTYKGKPSSPLNWTEATKSHNLEVVGNIYENPELLEG